MRLFSFNQLILYLYFDRIIIMVAQKQEFLIEMISKFSDEYLDDEFKALNLKLLDRLSDTPEVSLNRGKPENWACAIIMAVGQLNFLFDYPIKPYITQDMLCGYFTSKRQSVTIKARDIRRLLNLKLGDEEFSTSFVLSMGIPESEDDLKRIRQLDEIKFLISNNRPDDEKNVENEELLKMIHEGCIDEKFRMLLRKSYFIFFRGENGMIGIDAGDGNFKVPLFTDFDKCSALMGAFFGARPVVWPFVNVIDYIGAERFKGVLINPETDNFTVSEEIIEDVYENHENIDYWHIFFPKRW